MGESTATLALVIKARDMASGQVGKLNRNLRSLKTGALDALPIGFMGAAGAAAVLTTELAKGLRGAIEEEAGIARLTTVLRENVTGWDGNTEAVEAAIKPRMDLGFADDELRASLAKLVPATKNVNRALELQTTAMDLARLKGVSLEEASQALVDIDGGRYRALGKLIGSTKDITSETQALAAVQEVAAGQAQAYMETTAGKLEQLQVRWDELTETVAGAAIPVINDFANAITNLGPVVDGLTGKTEVSTDATLDFVNAVAGFLPTGALVKPMVAEVRGEIKKLGDKAWDAGGKMEYLGDRSVDAADRAHTAWWTFAQIYASLRRSTDPTEMMHNPFASHTTTRKRKKKKADGGWVGLYGPEDITVGERGPEYVTANHAAGSPRRGGIGGVTIQGVTERELMDMVDRQLYFRLRRAAPARG